MAASSVFTTYELLEQILLGLPLRRLLLAQRINKACYDVVKRSSDIRKALFLAPSGETAYSTGARTVVKRPNWEILAWWYSASEEVVEMHTWMKEEGELSYIDDERSLDMFGDLELKGLVRRVRPIVNPFLTMNKFSDGEGGDLNPLLRKHDYLPIKEGCGVHFSRCHDRGGKYSMNASDHYEITSGSWDSMFTTQPPVRMVSVVLPDGQERIDKGNRLWDLYEACAYSWESTGIARCLLYDSRDWVHIAADVDSITGYEMLDVLDMSHEELVDEGLLWWSEDL